MADTTEVQIGENSPQQVAYKLMGAIASAEGKILHGQSTNSDREWILRTYAQCLYVVMNPHWVGDALKPGFGNS